MSSVKICVYLLKHMVLTYLKSQAHCHSPVIFVPAYTFVLWTYIIRNYNVEG